VNKRAHHAPPRANTNRLKHRLNEAPIAIRSGNDAHAEHLLSRLAADYPSNPQILLQPLSHCGQFPRSDA
jgi:hypothetical protein